MSTDFGDTERDDPMAAVEFYPADAAAATLVKRAFAGEEILESDAFTGTQIVTVIVAATGKALGPLLAFFAANRPSYRDATVKIGRTEIALKGYTAEEVRGLLDSPEVLKLLKELKKK